MPKTAISTNPPSAPCSKNAVNGETSIIDLIAGSPFHMAALHAARDLNLPDWCIAAGFVRNAVWDAMHGYKDFTPLNDIDVLYFDTANTRKKQEKEYEAWLQAALPGLPWSVKNQARMHLKYSNRPYTDTQDAMYHWCETVTPVGVRLEPCGALTLLAPLGISDLISGNCRATPYAKSAPQKLEDYRRRMKEKNWPGLWPPVTLHDME